MLQLYGEVTHDPDETTFRHLVENEALGVDDLFGITCGQCVVRIFKIHCINLYKRQLYFNAARQYLENIQWRCNIHFQLHWKPT